MVNKGQIKYVLGSRTKSMNQRSRTHKIHQRTPKKKKIEKYSFNIVLPRLRFQEHRTFHFHTLNSRIQSRENEGIKY